MQKDRKAGYQFWLVALLSINFGIVFFDRNALNFLMPFVQPDLGLSNTQIGMLSSALALTWALAAFGVGRLSDYLGSRKGLLIASTLCFSLCSFLSGIASSFALLLGVRLLMGVAEGGIMPISQAMVATTIDPRHRGLAMGVTQNFGSNLLGSFVAPVALVAFAEAFGWRTSFYLAGIPGLMTAALLWWYIREEPAAPRHMREEQGPRMSIREAFAERNVLLCSLIAVVLVSYFITTLAFMPIFLTKVRGFDANTMGWLIGTLGISATVNSFLVSGLSDRIGRKPLMIGAPMLGVILPLGAMYFDGSPWLLAVIFFFGWSLNGIFPLFMATIPSESVDPLHSATVMGLVMGLGEVVGGVVSPTVAGYFGDRFGLSAVLWILCGLCLIGGVLAIGLRETAPRRRAMLAIA